ncbi:cholinesterase [Aspergillus sclerotiicarbonarius CBS 121057]|uniref:Carboxylic ester hydrolase n=1 Tax=Aspergillus sclerotiicarbonarius (strain CBS 121057 / IBT 28362) TaxID=1448318 RepID=A0A319ECZ6_ASPSB|nr:cholinesterase [Aspergillus sclerotiicarbonarius CBS 121057]
MKAPFQWALFATSTLKHLETGTPAAQTDGPTVTIPSPSATIIGEHEDENVEVFKGIPYAQPPIPTYGLRLKPPQPITTGLGTVQATGYPAACPQMDVRESQCLPLPPNVAALLGPTGPNPEVVDEDCLTLNIWRPKGTTGDEKYPVLFWIYGGSFEVGSNMDLPGGPIVSDSINQSMPIIFDQRLALEWVADNIETFGGDPSKVTIWGQSAGSHSVFEQMALYKGDNTYKGSPLFRGGIMNSGNTWPVDPVDGPKGQAVYDQVVENSPCSPCSPDTDTLACLRDLRYDDFLKAVNSVPSRSGHYSLSLSYLPRPDGTVLTASPEEAARNGAYAKVPFIVGDPEDDGSAVVFNMTNITTAQDVSDYLSKYYYIHASQSQIDKLVSIYDDDYEYGVPLHTGKSNSLYPQSKRLAAILADLTVLLTRRFVLDDATNHRDIPSWSFINSVFKGIPYLGTFHGSELYMREIWAMLQQDFPDLFPGDIERAISSIWSYYFSFVYHQDPNQANQTVKWTQWGEKQEVMNFGLNEDKMIPDNFREDATQFLVENIESFRM